VITTERLVIRPWGLDEADRLFDIRRRMEVARWLGGTPMRERREAVESIERYDGWSATDPRFGAWAVVERGAEVPAGTVLLNRLPDGDGEVEIGWHLHPDSWGRGYATEAATAVLQRGIAGGLEEVWAVTHLENDRSVAVCRKVGMTLLGVTHRWYHVPSLMFWVGSRPGQEPSLEADEAPPPERAAEAAAGRFSRRRR
jgi:RimJ/RimL family protein N-acetyltransferase